MHTKLTPALSRTLCDAVATGISPSLACLQVGTVYTSCARWLSRGNREPGSVFADFRAAYLQAREEGERVRAASALPLDVFTFGFGESADSDRDDTDTKEAVERTTRNQGEPQW
jgi:hypothetical protein